MGRKLHKIAATGGAAMGAALLATLIGCTTDGSYRRAGYEHRPAVQVQAVVDVQDDYDYYPGYETYYSRNRHVFVYRDHGVWVRRPAPRGVSLQVLLASPTVRVDFHDSPELHHTTVVRTYPRNWAPEKKKPDDRKNHRDKKQDDRNDANDHKDGQR